MPGYAVAAVDGRPGPAYYERAGFVPFGECHLGKPGLKRLTPV